MRRLAEKRHVDALFIQMAFCATAKRLFIITALALAQSGVAKRLFYILFHFPVFFTILI